MKTSFYDLNFNDLCEFVQKNALNESVASNLFNWHYKKKNLTKCTKDISKTALALIDDKFDFELPEVDLVHESADKTVKFLFKLQDGSKVESVLIPFHNKYYNFLPPLRP